MLELIRSLFTPNVDRILASFTKTIVKLEAARDYYNDAASSYEYKASLYNDLANQASAESVRALIVANKMKNLLS